MGGGGEGWRVVGEGGGRAQALLRQGGRPCSKASHLLGGRGVGQRPHPSHAILCGCPNHLNVLSRHVVKRRRVNVRRLVGRHCVCPFPLVRPSSYIPALAFTRLARGVENVDRPPGRVSQEGSCPGMSAWGASQHPVWQPGAAKKLLEGEVRGSRGGGAS